MKTLKELLLERDVLDKAIAETRKTQRKAALIQVRELIAIYQITASEAGVDPTKTVVGKLIPKKDARSKDIAGHREFDLPPSLTIKKSRSNCKTATKVEPKYRDSSGNTWTGRGKPPRWLAAAEATGLNRADYLIQNGITVDDKSPH